MVIDVQMQSYLMQFSGVSESDLALDLILELQAIVHPIVQDRRRELGPMCRELNEQFDTTLVMTCSACPLQIEGNTVDGKYIYFRSRWDSWQFHVGTSKDAMFGVQSQPDIFYLEGLTESDGSWIDPSEARQILIDCLTKYKASAI